MNHSQEGNRKEEEIGQRGDSDLLWKLPEMDEVTLVRESIWEILYSPLYTLGCLGFGHESMVIDSLVSMLYYSDYTRCGN
jgi:hypothetical protein